MSRYYELLKNVESRPDAIVPVPQPEFEPSRRVRPWPAATPESTAEGTDWLRFWHTLVKHWRISAFFAGATFALVVLFTMLVRPVYEPTARIEIDPPGAELFSLEARSGALNDAEYLETQARNLESDELAITVIRRLQLDKNPDLASTGTVSKVVGGSLSAVQKVPRLLWVQKATTASPEGAPGLKLTPTESKVLDKFDDQLTVKRDTASRLVSISFASFDPVLSAEVTNSIVHTFIERTYETRHDAIMQSTQWLSRQLDDIKGKMDESNRALAEFQRATGIADLDQNRSTFTENVAELSRQKTQAQTERIQIESYLSRVRSGRLATLPQIQSSQVIQQLTQRLAETRAELSNMRAVYGPNHANTKKLQNQVDELQAQINLQQNAILAQLQTTYAAAKTREYSLEGELRGSAKQATEMAQYSALKKEAEANSALYNSLYGRIKEAGISAASKSSNIRIVDQARILDKPTRPQPLINFGVGLLVALVGGVMLAFIREALDNRIHTAEELRKATGMSVAVLPLAPDLVHLRETRGLAKLLSRTPTTVLHVGTPQNFLTDRPGSMQAEAMRGLQTSIMLSQPQRPPQVLLVLSSVPGEGKTTIAMNLAIAFAKLGQTCLIDADLRRPGVARAFDIANDKGLGNCLSNGTDIDSVLFPVERMANLTIMPAGVANGDPGTLISPEKVLAIVNKLRDRFEYVVIDSPPILPYADGRIMAPFVDGVVLVGRAGIITREEITRTIELLDEIHSAPVLEIVLNAADKHTPDYHYYQHRYN